GVNPTLLTEAVPYFALLLHEGFMKRTMRRAKGCATPIIIAGLSFAAWSVAAFTTFDYETKLNAPGPLAISGNTVVAGGYVFVRTDRAWVKQFVAPMNFSSGVAIDADTLFVLPDVYVRNGTTWSVQQELVWSGIPAISSNTIAISEWN